MDIYSFGRTPREADRVYRKQVERAWVALVEHGGVIDPSVRDFIRDSWTRCLSMGVEPVGNTPEQFAEQIRRDQEHYLRLVRDTGLKVE